MLPHLINLANMHLSMFLVGTSTHYVAVRFIPLRGACMYTTPGYTIYNNTFKAVQVRMLSVHDYCFLG